MWCGIPLIQTRLGLADEAKFEALRTRDGTTKSELLRKLATAALDRTEV